MQLAQVLGVQLRRRIEHQVGGAGGLRKCDDLANVRLIRKQHDEPVNARRHSSVRRRPVLESIQHVSEAPVRLLITVSQAPEDPRLDVAPVYADAPARQLVAIAHQIISVAQHGPRVRFKNIEMFLLGHGEGMMDEAPVLLLLIPLEHRKDRKSTRLNSSHITISYAVFCLKKKNNTFK